MKPKDPTPTNIRVKLEERILALLLGELDPGDIAEVQRLVNHDPVLAQYHRQMQRILGLVQKASAATLPSENALATEGDSPGAPSQLDADRQRELREHFQTTAAAPEPLTSVDRQKASPLSVWRERISWGLPRLAAACLILFAGWWLVMPMFFKARTASQRNANYLPPLAMEEPSEYEFETLDNTPSETEHFQRSIRGVELAFNKDAIEVQRESLGRYFGNNAPDADGMGMKDPMKKEDPNGDAEVAGFYKTPIYLPGASVESDTKASQSFGLVLQEEPNPQDVSGGIINGIGMAGGAGLSGLNRQASEPPTTARPGSASGRDWSGLARGQAQPLEPTTENLFFSVQEEEIKTRKLAINGKTSMNGLGTSDKAQNAPTSLATVLQPPTLSVSAPASKPESEVRLAETKKTPNDRFNIEANGRLGQAAQLERLSDFADVSRLQTNALAKSLNELRQIPARRDKENQTVFSAEPKEPPSARPAVQPATQPLPEVLTDLNRFSTFSLNVSDVSFKLAAASLANNTMPDKATVRSEEFINALNYHDPAPAPGAKLAFAWQQAHSPFEHQRDLVRFSIQTAARGREPGRPLNLVLLLDNSGSMERADRVQIIREALGVLAQQLKPTDRVSVVAFARTARLWVDGMAGGQPEELLKEVGNLNPQGGTNLELALQTAYATAQKHFHAGANNRVILLTDGAANLGNVNPASLKGMVEDFRRRDIALDCFGVGWEGYDDNLLEMLSRNGDGRYGFINHPQEAAAEFADQLAGALQVAAANVKAQVEFNPARVISYRQIGYQKHQLTKEQFRDNTVDAAEIGAAESGTALYAIQVNPAGQGPLGTVRVRFKSPATGLYQEREWVLPYQPNVPSLDQAYPAMRLAGVAASFAEWLAESPFAGNVTLSALQGYLNGVPETYPFDPRPRQLQAMIQQARNITGR